MDQAILKTLNQARLQLRPVVLITEIATGKQTIYLPDETPGQPALEDKLLEGAKRVLRTDRCYFLESEHHRHFFQPYNPPLRVVIIGAVHIAQALVPLLKQCHYHVTIIDPRQAFATDERFPDIEMSSEWPDKALQTLGPDRRTAVVTLTHDPKLDDPALEMALRSEAFYIGALGSRKTQATRIERLRDKGFSEDQFKRIHGPIGLDIGAESPAEIAVSIMAEITQTLRSTRSDAV